MTNEKLTAGSHRLAIVILNWNGKAMMQEYLPSVINNSSAEADIYVADNASSDDSIAMLEHHFPQVRLIRLDKNYGFAEGYNRALRQIEAEYYLLLNSDVRVPQNWISPLLAFMDAHPEAAACQPKMLSIHHPESFEYAGASGGFLDRLGYPFCRGRIFTTVEEDKGQYDDIVEVGWASGACLLIRAADYWQAGGLDGRFFAHCEEIDLCWRLRTMGRKVFCVPDSHVYHLGGGTLPKGNSRKTFLNFRNNLTMIYKNMSDDRLRSVMRVRWALDWLAAFEMLILGRNVGDFVAVYKGRKAFHQWKHDFDADRKRIQNHRVTSDENILKPYSILWQYYLKRKKCFSTI